MGRKVVTLVMERPEYPVHIKTEIGEVNTGWSEGQRDDDMLLIGTFTEDVANALIRINKLYEENQPISAMQFQMNLILNFTKAQKQLLRANRKEYEAN